MHDDKTVWDSYISTMSEYRGQVVTIDRVFSKYYIKEDKHNHNWTDEMFEEEVFMVEMSEDTLASFL